MKTRVLDPWAIMEWISGRSPAFEYVRSLLAESAAGNAALFMSAINAGEVYYFLRKHKKHSLADSWRRACVTLPAALEVPTADEIWDAASLKGQFPISYADEFAAALAIKRDCPLVTGDTEFRNVTHLQLDWIGS